ncbi:MAG: hypothetical protein Q4F74_02435 [Synergistaceae bacterium]|nr:hypothetical protein [Synergistaceae bacterium]
MNVILIGLAVAACWCVYRVGLYIMRENQDITDKVINYIKSHRIISVICCIVVLVCLMPTIKKMLPCHYKYYTDAGYLYRRCVVHGGVDVQVRDTNWQQLLTCQGDVVGTPPRLSSDINITFEREKKSILDILGE